MRAELANLKVNQCTVPCIKPRHRQLLLVVLYYICMRKSTDMIQNTP